MRKIFKYILFCILLFSCAFASDVLYVEAIDNFSSENPDTYFQVKLVKDGELDGFYLFEGDTINCKLKKVTDPKRAKMDAQIYFELVNYKDLKGEHEFQDLYIAKYSSFAITKEEIEKLDKGEIAQKAALTAGDFVVPGLSYAYNFAAGMNENAQNNRLKSGIKNVYDNSFLSYVEYGDEVQIKTGDRFYFRVKKYKDD